MVVVTAVVLHQPRPPPVSMYLQRQKIARVKDRFGPEYDRAVNETGAPAKAAAALEDRVRRVEKFKIHPLTPEQASPAPSVNGNACRECSWMTRIAPSSRPTVSSHR